MNNNIKTKQEKTSKRRASRKKAKITTKHGKI